MFQKLDRKNLLLIVFALFNFLYSYMVYYMNTDYFRNLDGSKDDLTIISIMFMHFALGIGLLFMFKGKNLKLIKPLLLLTFLTPIIILVIHSVPNFSHTLAYELDRYENNINIGSYLNAGVKIIFMIMVSEFIFYGIYWFGWIINLPMLIWLFRKNPKLAK